MGVLRSIIRMRSNVIFLANPDPPCTIKEQQNNEVAEFISILETYDKTLHMKK